MYRTDRVHGIDRSLLLLLLALGLLPASAGAQPLFTDATATSLPAFPWESGMDVEAVDIDRDGDLDLIIANEFKPNLLLLNDGEGRFTDATEGRLPLDKGHDSEDIAVADFNGDGHLDIVFVSEDDFTHEYYLNDGTTHFTDVSDRLPRSVSNAVVAGDLTGDGRPDLVIGNAGQDFLLVNDGSGSFRDETATRLPKEFNVTQDVELADIDGDGNPDLIVGNEDGNKILINDGSGVFADETTARLPILADMETRKVTPVDIDKDGDLDLYMANVGWAVQKDPQDRIFINDGTGVFDDMTKDLMPTERGTTLDGKFADIDGDGDPDLIMTDLGARPLRAFLNDGSGKLIEASLTVFAAPVVVDGLGLEFADLNGDTFVDLYVLNRHDQQRDRLLLSTRGKASGVKGDLHEKNGGVELRALYPNPAGARASIEYTLPRPMPVSLSVVDSGGETVATLARSPRQEAGEHRIEWDCAGLPPGVYFCRIEADAAVVTGTLVVGK